MKAADGQAGCLRPQCRQDACASSTCAPTEEIPESSGDGERVIMYRDALNEALREEMRRDSTIFLMGEGIAERGGSYKVTVDLLKEFGPRRVIDTPIAEASFTGAGVGAAITGMRPVVEILFVDFAMLAMDQIVNQAAKVNFMTGGQRRAPLVVRTQGGAGNGLAAQHSQSLEAMFYHVPGLQVVVPSTPRDAKGLLKAALRQDDPVMFLEHKLLYLTTGPVPNGEYVIEFGQADVKRPGGDVTLIAWSYMTTKALAAAEQLASDGIAAEVLDLRTLVPLDRQKILESVRKTEHVVIVQEAPRRGGVASDIASIIQAEAFDYLDSAIEIVAGLNTPIPYNLALEAACVPQESAIVAAAKRAVYASG
ncbi:MAG: alpha-ketoacid dehydrogenase subunit beta [Acidobacteriota bacterium]